MRNIYGGQLPVEPNMQVTEPTSLSYGVITESTAKTFTIANIGLATLEGISVVSSNAAFTVSNVPTSLAANSSQEVTITMAATSVGAQSSIITVSATGMDDVQFTVSGAVMKEGTTTVDFEDNQLPARWTSAGSWTFENGEAGAKSAATMTTPAVVVENGDFLAIKVRNSGSWTDDYIQVESYDGSSWTVVKKIMSTDFLSSTDKTVLLVSDVPTTTKQLRFTAYYAFIDEIAGLTYAPVLTVTKDEATVETPAEYDFGECATDATVTYNFANAGVGTINITNVAITGDGAAAYSTNWTESVAAPFDLTITRSYDADRTEAQTAAVTVTTSEGDFVINVTGTDKAANAPELFVSASALDFGTLKADSTETITVTNNGTGVLAVTIASDSEDFVVSTSELTEIGAGASKEFTVTFKFSEGDYGAKAGNITVTPSYDETAAQVIAVTAKAVDPEAWTEDFTTTPTNWEVGTDWAIEDGVAKGSYVYGSTTYLTTPKLTVAATSDELSFDYQATANYVSVKIQMSKDGAAFADYQTIANLDKGDAGTYTITGLEAGIYQFRFKNDDYQLDNFEGFKVVATPDHAAEVAENGLSVPATGNQFVSYTASVKVKVTGKNAETLTAKFFIGETQYGEAVVKEVAANTTETFKVSFKPDTALSGDAYFTIESENITAFETEKTAVTISAATIWTDNTTNEVAAGDYESLVIQYNLTAGWNTLCLPIASNVTSFGEGVKIYSFSSYAENQLLFTEHTLPTLNPATPYVLYSNADVVVILINPNTTIYSTYIGEENIASTRGNVVFQGTYNPMAAESLTGKYYLTSDGTLAAGTATTTLNGFRAYFVLADAEKDYLTFKNEDGTTTAIKAVELGSSVEGAYNLNGQKVERLNKRGLYIINGKKVVMK